ASGTSTISIARTGGFTGSVAFSAGGLPTGVTATFSPASTTGNSATVTLAASSSATLGAATGTVTGSGGGLTRTTQIPLPIGTGGGGTGGETITPIVNSSSPWFNEEDLRLANTAGLTTLSLTIVIQRTTGVSFNGQYNTVGNPIQQSNTSTASTVTYQ